MATAKGHQGATEISKFCKLLCTINQKIQSTPTDLPPKDTVEICKKTEDTTNVGKS